MSFSWIICRVPSDILFDFFFFILFFKFYFWVALRMVSLLGHCWDFVIQRYIGVLKCMVWNDQTSKSISTLLFTLARDFISWKHAILSFNVSLVNVLFPHFIVAFTFYSALFMHLSIWIKQVCESSQCMQTEKACSKVRDP